MTDHKTRAVIKRILAEANDKLDDKLDDLTDPDVTSSVENQFGSDPDAAPDAAPDADADASATKSAQSAAPIKKAVSQSVYSWAQRQPFMDVDHDPTKKWTIDPVKLISMSHDEIDGVISSAENRMMTRGFELDKTGLYNDEVYQYLLALVKFAEDLKKKV